MADKTPETQEQLPEMHGGNSPGTLKGPAIISYNLREEERPGGLKARFKVKIETGRKARELDARQAAAIRELLIWARQRQHQTST